MGEPPARSALRRPPCIPSNKVYISEKAQRIEWRTMSDEGRPACEIHKDENGDVFVLVAGTKIAKRGLPGTAHADTWITLERGWVVRDVEGGNAIEVRYQPTRMH